MNENEIVYDWGSFEILIRGSNTLKGNNGMGPDCLDILEYIT